MSKLRDLFHDLANKHNMLTVGVGLSADIVEECADEATSLELKDKLSKVNKDLEQIVKAAQEADKIVTEIKKIVYTVIDPDTEKPKVGG